MASRTQKLVLSITLLGLLGGGGFAYWNSGQKAEDAIKHQLAIVARGTVEDVVSAQGTLEPKDYVDVGVQVSGQLKKLYVDIGDEVKTGDLLAELDAQTYAARVQGDEASIAALQAQLNQQKAQADYDKLQLDRAAKLLPLKAISQQELEEKEKALKVSQATVEALQAQIAQAQATLENDRINLGYTKIYAPMDGIVSDRTAREGQTLNANQTTPKILQLANLDVMTIRAQVAEADVMRLKPGMESEFATLGSLERKWKGTIRQILPTPEEVNDVVLYNALIDVENKDRQLMNGMSTQNSFVVGRAESTLYVPTRALTRSPNGYGVRVLSAKGEIEKRSVEVGLITRSRAEIKSGLAEGEQVIISADTGETKKASSGPRPPNMARL